MSASAGTTVMVQGRIVWVSGDLFKGRIKTVFGTQTPQVDAQGKNKMEYGFGLAIPKSVLAESGPGQPGEIWAALHSEAMKLFPNGQIPPTFPMKFKDGDGVDDKGVPFSAREGYAGHIVLACTTSLPIKFFKFEGGQHFQISEGIKNGDYVNVQLGIKVHPAVGQGKAGLYVNPNAVQFLGYGKEIVNTPSGGAIFGNVAPPLPPGASATPIAQAGFIAPPQTHAGTPFPITPQAAPVMSTPNYGVLPTVHQPQAAQAAPLMPPIPGFRQQ